MNQHQINLEIEKFVKEKDSKNESYTQADIDYILQYSGAGGKGKFGAKGEGVLYEFYTPEFICELMWKLALHYGYDGGTVLEPSIATGRLIQHAPDKSKCIGFEINPTTARICEIAYPKAKIYNGYFETAFLQPDRFTSLFRGSVTWLNQYPFSLVIGNPPYGLYKNMYSGYFNKKLFKQIEIFFIYKGLEMLKKGGLLVYILSSNFLSNGISYDYAKQEIGKIADIIDAYRLPKVFETSDVPTDIMILKRK